MSTNTTVSYDFDPTGTLAANRIVGEIKVLTPPNYLDFYFIIPAAAPFFVESLEIVHLATSRILVRGVDWVPSYRFHDASLACAKDIYGAITIYDKTLAGACRINYQTIGGDWTLDEAKILELLSDAITDPRVTTWEMVVERPVDFPVIDHEWDLVDLVGMSKVVDAVYAIAEAVQAASDAGLPAHLADYNNPHRVTQAQVGLDLVQNYAVATPAEAAAGTAADKYMTALRTRQAITAVLATTFDLHASNQNNPHGVNSNQVGLGNVQNYGVATVVEAQAGTATAKYMTPALVKSAIDSQVMSVLTPHVASTANPHQTNKSQVGLGSVENLPLADVSTARAGTSNAHYMTPALVREAINAQLLANLDQHLADHNNPHQVTKTQVGLGSVQNFALATTAEAQAGVVTDKYMTPALVKAAVESLGGAEFNSHIIDTNNPHQTTKDQVGLGNVSNYGVATVNEAQAGVSNVKYMTPALVKAAIDQFGGAAITDHVANLNNPHQVSAAQVGLDNVQNYAVATLSEAQAGTATNKYMTPALVKEALDAQGATQWRAHVASTANPHQVTKAQIGLTSVEDYAPASDAEAVAGTATNKYMTPANVAAAIIALGGVAALRSEFEGHAANTSNPHQVTASQVGAYSIGEIDDRLAAFNAQYPQVDDVAGATWTKLFTFDPIDPIELLDSVDTVFELIGGDAQVPLTDSQFRITLPSSGLDAASITQLAGGPANIRFGYTAETLGYSLWLIAAPRRTNVTIHFITNPGVVIDGTVEAAAPAGLTIIEQQPYQGVAANQEGAAGDLLFGSDADKLPNAAGQVMVYLNVVDSAEGEAVSSVNALPGVLADDMVEFVPRSLWGTTPPISSDAFVHDPVDNVISASPFDDRLNTLVSRDGYNNYRIEVELDSADATGGTLGVIAAHINYRNKSYGIYALRTPGQLVVDSKTGDLPGGDIYKLFTVGVNLLQADARVLGSSSGDGLVWGDGVIAANRDLTAQPYNETTGGWSAAGKVRIRITRTGSQLVVETTNFGSTSYVDAAKVTIDLSTLDLPMFTRPTMWGVASYKQSQAGFNPLARPDSLQPYAQLTKDAQGRDTSTLHHYTGTAWSSTPLIRNNSLTRPGRLIFSDWNGRLMHWRRDGSIRPLYVEAYTTANNVALTQ